jgi:hypothetical protein
MQSKIKIRSIASAIQADEHSIDNSRCIHCGANLPWDIEFQEYHMSAIHGLFV